GASVWPRFRDTAAEAAPAPKLSAMAESVVSRVFFISVISIYVYILTSRRSRAECPGALPLHEPGGQERDIADNEYVENQHKQERDERTDDLFQANICHLTNHKQVHPNRRRHHANRQVDHHD